MANVLSLLLLLLLQIGCSFHGNLALSSPNNSTVFQPGKAYFSTQSNSSFWVSPNGELTFGFKSVAMGEYLLSIWFCADPNQTALWWPAILTGSSDPIVTTGALFNFTSQGTFQLSDAKGIVVWSTDHSISNASFAALQNSGNLVLLDQSQNILWQSFADLRDSLMLGSTDEALVIDKPYLLQSRENQSSFVAGRFHLATDFYQNLYVHALDHRHNVDFIYMYASMNVTGNFEIWQDNGKAFHGNASQAKSTLKLDDDGNLRIYSWISSSKSWQEIWEIVDDKCKLGSPCGPYGICMESAGGTINCTCPPGYYVLDAEDASQGCGSSLNFSAICAYGGNTNDSLYSMAEMIHSDYYYNDLSVGSDTDVDECKTLCLNDCNCVAASHRDSDNTCFLKGNATTGFLMNGYSTDGNTLLIKVASSASGGEGINNRIATSIGVATGFVLLVIVICGVWLLKRRRHQHSWRGRQEVEMHSETGPMRLTYQQVVEATNNFTEALGEGGFGKVYKGWVMTEKKGDGSEQLVVAVKVLKARNHEEEGVHGNQRQEEAEKQFRAEVSTLGKIHHVNLVKLLGYCTGEKAGERRVLVYEYIEKGSLDKYLSKVNLLPWPTRYSIALGTSRGIAYLHHDCDPRILHCDIKPQNVLLDYDFTVKVADFGFAKRFQQQKSHLTVSGMRGTRGYMAPEWLTSDEVTPKADVYSFGMLLLQLVRQDQEDDGISLVDWAFKGIEELSEILRSYDHTKHSNHGDRSNSDADEPNATKDQDLEHHLQKLLLLKIGLWCIQYLPALRPSMARIVQLIEGGSPEDVDGPPYPAPRMPWASDSESSSKQSYSSMNAYSNSILSGR